MLDQMESELTGVRGSADRALAADGNFNASPAAAWVGNSGARPKVDK